MTHRAAILRDANAGQTDAGGQPLPPDWQPHLADVPCRCWAEPSEEVSADGDRTVVVEGRRIIFPVGTDVTEADRVARVTDRRGNLIFDGPARIEGLVRRPDHLSAVLEVIE